MVYACGDQGELPSLEQRAVVMQALLHLISDLADLSDVEGSPLHKGIAV
jgi:hypothetical protein